VLLGEDLREKIRLGNWRRTFKGYKFCARIPS